MLKPPFPRPSRVVLAVAAALLFGAGAPLGQAQVNLPALGDSASADFDVPTERRLGEQIMRQIRVDPDYVDDPLLLEYLQGIWSPLVQSAQRLGNISDETADRFAWEIFLVRDRTINAFALPGGFVGVHLGLIAMTVSRDELASVLGHELSHVTQRHIARRIAGDSRNSLLATAAMIAGLIAASRAGSTDMANAAIVGGQAAAAAASLAFSRDMEREADRVGFNVMTHAGFAASGMSSMFERMEQAYHLMDSGNYPYLRSHPLTSERIGDARLRLGTAEFLRPRGLAEHALMAARARVLMDPRAETWAQLQNLDAGARDLQNRGQDKGFEQLGARYAAALASIKMRNYPRAESALRSAEQMLQSLGGDARAQRVLSYLGAELAQAREQAAAGYAALQPLAGERSRVMLMQRAQLAMVDPDPAKVREAAETLQTYVSLNSHDALAWNQLAQLWDKLGQPLRAVRAQGEARAAAGDLNGAIDRLRSGLRLSRGRDADQIEASVIDARLRTLLYERRQLLAEMYPRGAPPGAELP
ncbi:M48 family metalloprotease [Roseateles violae]|uniref:M48 family metalloprotease n=1 Tax=Roseateles violae TaxID=3058042 RepID=A0ABT8DKI1_9BURK|nr:M48 family metalloprotease [Pelomonas sp. PFR6]MDN3918925.1 M48 family metalloprotease [Pelomonas sp. PFR6]